MKKYSTLIVFFLTVINVLCAQNLDLFPEYKRFSQDEPIEVNGNELNFKVMNVCHEDIVFALPATASQGTSIVSNYDFSNISYIDTSISSSKINGLATSYIGYDFRLHFTTDDDTLHIRNYEFSQSLTGMPQIINSTEIYIPNILTLVGTPDYLWVVAKTADSVSLISVFQTSNGIEFRDTIGLSFNTIELVQNNDADIHFSHLAGKDTDGNLHYYRFDSYLKTFKHFTIDAFQEELLYIGGNDSKSVIISKNGNNLIAYESALNISTYSSSSLGTYDSIISVSGWYESNWGSNNIVVLVKNNAQTTAKIFTINGWSNNANYSMPVDARRIYSSSSWGSWLLGYLEYSNSIGGLFLSQIESPFVIDTSKKYSIEESPSLYKRASICFVGVDNKTLPEVKTYLYPNPAKENFTIVIKNVPCDVEHHLELYNLNGDMLYETPFYSKCELKVPTENLSSGMYLLKLKINNKIYTRKLMKQ